MNQILTYQFQNLSTQEIVSIEWALNELPEGFIDEFVKGFTDNNPDKKLISIKNKNTGEMLYGIDGNQ